VERGILLQNQDVCPFANIESIRLRKTLFGLLFRYGTIEMSAPILSQKMVLKNVPRARTYMELLERNIEEQRSGTVINSVDTSDSSRS
jgi:hypothetical protein